MSGSDRLRILQMTYSTRPRGGVVHTLALAEALARTGAEVTVRSVARGGDTAFFRPLAPDVAVELVPFADDPAETVGPRIVRSIAALGTGLSPERFDVVHAQDCISANAALAAGCADRLVRTVHHLDTFTTPQLVSCHERALVGPRRHLCVSAAVASELRAGWGIDATVIPNGVDAGRFAAAAGPGQSAARQAWAERIAAPYVLAVGGIEPRKGAVDLVDAYADLRAVRPDVALVLAGGETLFDYRDYRDEFDRRCAQRAVAPVLLGPVDHDALPALVAAASVFAFFSTKEGFGLAAMEALAAGVPVVVRDLPVLREVFGVSVRRASSVAGLAGALIEALGPRDPARADAGRALAARHSWAGAADQHLAFYRRAFRSCR